MSPESAALFRNAGSLLIAVLFMASVWIVIVPMLEGDKKKKRMESVATAREGMRKTRLDSPVSYTHLTLPTILLV